MPVRRPCNQSLEDEEPRALVVPADACLGHTSCVAIIEGVRQEGWRRVSPKLIRRSGGTEAARRSASPVPTGEPTQTTYVIVALNSRPRRKNATGVGKKPLVEFAHHPACCRVAGPMTSRRNGHDWMGDSNHEEAHCPNGYTDVDGRCGRLQELAKLLARHVP